MPYKKGEGRNVEFKSAKRICNIFVAEDGNAFFAHDNIGFLAVYVKGNAFNLRKLSSNSGNENIAMGKLFGIYNETKAYAFAVCA